MNTSHQNCIEFVTLHSNHVHFRGVEGVRFKSLLLPRSTAKRCPLPSCKAQCEDTPHTHSAPHSRPHPTPICWWTGPERPAPLPHPPRAVIHPSVLSTSCLMGCSDGPARCILSAWEDARTLSGGCRSGGRMWCRPRPPRGQLMSYWPASPPWGVDRKKSVIISTAIFSEAFLAFTDKTLVWNYTEYVQRHIHNFGYLALVVPLLCCSRFHTVPSPLPRPIFLQLFWLSMRWPDSRLGTNIVGKHGGRKWCCCCFGFDGEFSLAFQRNWSKDNRKRPNHFLGKIGALTNIARGLNADLKSIRRVVDPTVVAAALVIHWNTTKSDMKQGTSAIFRWVVIPAGRIQYPSRILILSQTGQVEDVCNVDFC